MANAADPFVFLGPDHVVATALAVAFALCVPLLARHCATGAGLERLGRILALVLVAQVAINLVVRVGLYGLPLQENLPLHLCGASLLVGAVALWFRNAQAFELAYFWALGGATLALLTPDLPYGFPHPFFLVFFSGHALELTAVSFAMIALGLRPRHGAARRAILTTAVFATAIFPLNFLLGSNYLFLRHKPVAATPMDWMGPWPVYILFMALLATAMIHALALPFRAGTGRNG